MERLGITGGSGFVGRALSARLVAAGRAGELLQIGRSDPAAGSFTRFDLESGPARPLPSLARLVHLAAWVPPDQHGEDALACERANGRGVLRLLDALDPSALRRVVNVGSFHVWHPSETGRLTNAYEGSKLSAQLLLRAFAVRFGFELVTLRLPYVYGPGMVHGRMFRVFIEQALAGKPLQLFRNGRDPLHLLYVDDAAEAIEAAVDVPALDGELDLGPSEPVTALQVAETVVELTGSSSEIRLLPGDPPPARPHRAGATRERLGVVPRTALREGVAALLAADYGAG